jgi:hypothetical protein
MFGSLQPVKSSASFTAPHAQRGALVATIAVASRRHTLDREFAIMPHLREPACAGEIKTTPPTSALGRDSDGKRVAGIWIIGNKNPAGPEMTNDE